MSDDTRTAVLIAFCSVVSAALLFAFGYAVHTNNIREDAARVDCIDRGYLWIGEQHVICIPVKVQVEE